MRVKLVVAPAVAVLLVLSAWLAGCGSAPDAAQTPSDLTQGTAAVKCTDEGAVVLTQSVRARADGIHVVVENVTRQTMVLNYEVDHGDSGGGDTIVPPGRSTHIVPLAGRSLGISCVDETEDANTLDFALDYKQIKVQGNSRSSDLDCGEVIVEEVNERTTGPEPVALSREFLGSRGLLEMDDRVERAASGPESPVVRLVRRGRVIAALWYRPMAAESADFELYAVQHCR